MLRILPWKTQNASHFLLSKKKMSKNLQIYQFSLADFHVIPGAEGMRQGLVLLLGRYLQIDALRLFLEPFEFG